MHNLNRITSPPEKICKMTIMDEFQFYYGQVEEFTVIDSEPKTYPW